VLIDCVCWIQPGHADSYENLKVTFIFGRSPELTLKDDSGSVVEKIDLAPMTTEQIHKLLQDKGFERKAAGTKSVQA
jgi:hypothetical protein